MAVKIGKNGSKQGIPFIMHTGKWAILDQNFGNFSYLFQTSDYNFSALEEIKSKKVKILINYISIYPNFEAFTTKNLLKMLCALLRYLENTGGGSF